MVAPRWLSSDSSSRQWMLAGSESWKIVHSSAWCLWLITGLLCVMVGHRDELSKFRRVAYCPVRLYRRSMDQAALAHQGVLRPQRERGEDADLDGLIDLPVDRYLEIRLHLDHHSLYEFLQSLFARPVASVPLARWIPVGIQASAVPDYGNPVRSGATPVG